MKAYLDNAATTRLDPTVANAMQLAAGFGNPSSLHAFGREAHDTLEEARASVASQLGTTPDTIVFTSGATESDNLAVLGAARAAKDRGRHVITTAVEHSAVRASVRQLAREGFTVTEVGVDGTGRVSPAEIAAALRDDTVLVSVMLANNEIGTVQPIAEIRDAIGETTFHCDAAQAAGKVGLDVTALGVDLLTLSGHKMHGPRGVGVLYRAPKTPVEPLAYGGSHEHGLRPGTENVAGAVGFAFALSRAQRHLDDNISRIAGLRETLATALERSIPDAIFHGSPEHRLPTILNLSIPGLESEALVLALDAEGIAVSAGSACEAHRVEPSYVLKALGLEDSVARGSLRISLASDTTPDEVAYAAERIPAVVRRFRSAAE